MAEFVDDSLIVEEAPAVVRVGRAVERLCGSSWRRHRPSGVVVQANSLWPGQGGSVGPGDRQRDIELVERVRDAPQRLLDPLALLARTAYERRRPSRRSP
jgi:hypothetical protein